MEPLTIVLIALLGLIVLRLIWKLVRMAVKVIVIAVIVLFVIISFYMISGNEILSTLSLL